MVMMPHWPIYIGPDKDIIDSLPRIKQILDIFDNPHNKLNNIIHITGTKGKGSTTLYISNILKSSGYQVNTYISPHIYNCNERILLNGKMISDEYLYELIESIRFQCERYSIYPSLFETFTVCAFLAFAKTKADFNVIEVGMGGMLDATNVFDNNNPIATVFTPIVLDHKLWLGNTVESVAFHKSHIIKQNTQKVVLSSQPKEASKIIRAFAKRENIDDSNILEYGKDYEIYNIEGEDNSMLLESKQFGEYVFQKPRMEGEHQLINASCAIMTILALERYCSNTKEENISEGIHNTINIVRLERVKNGKLTNLLPKDSIFIMDGAHNQLASFALMKYIKRFYIENKDFDIVLIVAMSKGADHYAFLSSFEKDTIKRVICTRANLESLPESPENLLNTCKQLGLSSDIAYSTKEAILKVINITNKKLLIIATGSLYIARDINYEN